MTMFVPSIRILPMRAAPLFVADKRFTEITGVPI